MTNQREIYKCNICGNVVEVLFSGEGTLVCCGEKMFHQEEQHTGELALGHVPVYERNGDDLLISIGLMEHPMAQEHYIQMIEVITDNKILRKYLKPSDKPEFLVEYMACDDDYARAYCNKHGLWKGEHIC